MYCFYSETILKVGLYMQQLCPWHQIPFRTCILSTLTSTYLTLRCLDHSIIQLMKKILHIFSGVYITSLFEQLSAEVNGHRIFSYWEMTGQEESTVQSLKYNGRLSNYHSTLISNGNMCFYISEYWYNM